MNGPGEVSMEIKNARIKRFALFTAGVAHKSGEIRCVPKSDGQKTRNVFSINDTRHIGVFVEGSSCPLFIQEKLLREKFLPQYNAGS